MRRAAVEEAERDAGVRRVEQRALALDPEQLAAAAPTPSSTSRSDAPAMKSATTASTEIPQPAIAIPVCPVGTNALRARAAAPRASSSSATVIFPIAQSEPTVSTTARVVREVLAGRHVQAGRRLAQVAQLDAVARRELDELRVVGDELVQAVLDVEARRDAALQQLAPRRREAPAAVRDADERGGRVVGRAPRRRVPTIGKPSCVSPARSESSSATTCSGR